MPVVFSGSVGFNLDPYSTSEAGIWKLEVLSPSLAEVIKTRKGGLDSACGRGSFSGQRQIIVARTLLLKGTGYFCDEGVQSRRKSDVVGNALSSGMVALLSRLLTV